MACFAVQMVCAPFPLPTRLESSLPALHFYCCGSSRHIRSLSRMVRLARRACADKPSGVDGTSALRGAFFSRARQTRAGTDQESCPVLAVGFYQLFKSEVPIFTSKACRSNRFHGNGTGMKSRNNYVVMSGIGSRSGHGHLIQHAARAAGFQPAEGSGHLFRGTAHLTIRAWIKDEAASVARDFVRPIPCLRRFPEGRE